MEKNERTKILERNLEVALKNKRDIKKEERDRRKNEKYAKVYSKRKEKINKLGEDAFENASKQFKSGNKIVDEELLWKAKSDLNKAEDRRESWDIYSDDDAPGKIMLSATGIGAAAGFVAGVGLGVLTDFPIEKYSNFIAGSMFSSSILCDALSGFGLFKAKKDSNLDNPNTLPNVINYLNDKRVAKKSGVYEAVKCYNQSSIDPNLIDFGREKDAESGVNFDFLGFDQEDNASGIDSPEA